MNFALDENLPPSFAVALDALSGPQGHPVAHLRSIVRRGTHDTVWIKVLAAQGPHAIVSGDRRMLTRQHELKALRDAKLTSFVLAVGWSPLPFWEKAWLLVRWWPTIVDHATRHPDGVIFMVPHRQMPRALQEVR